MSNVLVIDGGGRGAVFAWKLSASPHVSRVFCAPGIGNARELGVENVDISVRDASGVAAVAKFVRTKRISLTVVGPEAVLALGIADALRSKGHAVFGPTKAAAQIETSKIFAKRLMQRFGIPTAPFATFERLPDAQKHVRACSFPVMSKLDGLARGTGVDKLVDLHHAEEVLRQRFDVPGTRLVIEEYLDGPEVSVHALSDGEQSITLLPSRDYKLLHGRNTGGMGTYAPLPDVSARTLEMITDAVVLPAFAGLRELGTPFTGCLYPGIVITPDGPMVLEYNARWGDPEAQSLLRLLSSDFYLLLDACSRSRLAARDVEWYPGFAVCVVLASQGYGEPGAKFPSVPISGLAEAAHVPGVVIFHAGTRFENGSYFTNGGRVLNVTAIGSTLAEARARAYQAVACISFEGMQYRDDIAAHAP